MFFESRPALPGGSFFGIAYPLFPLDFFFMSRHPKRLCPCPDKAGKKLKGAIDTT
jgi:hypothetical protein